MPEEQAQQDKLENFEECKPTVTYDYYKIKNIIRRRGDVYIIYASKDAKLYKIISYRNSTDSSKKRERIRIGKTYLLGLSSLLPGGTCWDGVWRPMMPNHGLRGHNMGNYVIRVGKRAHYSMYHAENLDGLYFK